MFRIPKIGYIQYYLSSILGWVAIIIVPAVMIIGYDIYKLIKTLKGDKNNNSNVTKKIEIKDKKEEKKRRFKK